VSENRLIYTGTMSFACSVERFRALERLASAAIAKSDYRGVYALPMTDEARALHREYDEAVAGVRAASR
jgi:hypothetical protein